MVSLMRSTVRIDDDLLEALKACAENDATSLTRALNTALRQGLKVANEARAKERFEQRTVSLRGATFDVDKALSVSAALEDDAVLAKLAARK